MAKGLYHLARWGVSIRAEIPPRSSKRLRRSCHHVWPLWANAAVYGAGMIQRSLLAFLLLAVATARAQDQAPQEGSCDQTIETHGFLSRGQFQCGFRYYGGGMLEAARECSNHMPKAEARHWLESGMQRYDFNENKRGHAAIRSASPGCRIREF
jgi:hypothetical protein